MGHVRARLGAACADVRALVTPLLSNAWTRTPLAPGSAHRQLGQRFWTGAAPA
jgi:hypothetical protein